VSRVAVEAVDCDPVRAEAELFRRGTFQAVVDGLPLGRAGRQIYGDPFVISSVSLVENFVEGSGVFGGGYGHLVDDDVCAVGRMLVLQVNSLALSGQGSIRR
jgi:hypothetical protein